MIKILRIKSWKYLFAILFSNLLILSICAIILDLIFGGYFRTNPFDKLNLVKNKSILYETENLYPSATGVAQYQRDRFGLRGVYSDPGSIDILTLGGSATDQRYLSEGETWQDVMHEFWRSLGKQVYVVNAGVDGQSTYGHSKNFDWWFPHIHDLKSRYILYYIGVNDLFGNAHSMWDDIDRNETQKHTAPPELQQIDWKDEHIPLTQRIFNAIEAKSIYFHIFRTSQGILQARRVKLGHGMGFRRSEQHWTTESYLTNHRTLIADELESYANRVSVLINLAKSMNARPVIVTQSAHYFLKRGDKILGFNDRGFMFNNHEVSGVDIYYLLKLFNEIALEQCLQVTDCIPIDLFSELDLDVGDFYDNVHNTPQGSKKIGLYLANKLDPFINLNTNSH